MFVRLYFLTLAALTVFTVLAVQAAFPAPAHASGWTGCYLGGGGAYSAVLTGQSLDVTGPGGGTLIAVDSYGSDGEGLFGTVGCDTQVGSRIIAGLWADYTWDHDTSYAITAPLFAGAPLMEASLENRWGAGGRLGYLVTDGAMVYVLAGYTQAAVSDLNFPAFGPGAFIGVPDLAGYVVGAGGEVDIGNGFFLQGQYSFTDYQSESIDLGDPILLNIDTDVQTARVGLLYRIGWDPVKAPPFKDAFDYSKSPKPLK